MNFIKNIGKNKDIFIIIPLGRTLNDIKKFY